MDKIDVVFELLKDNPETRITDVHIIADALDTYEEASDNVRRNGAIVAHPRTGAPMENPYVKIANSKAVVLLKRRQVQTDRVALLLREYYAQKSGA